MTAARAARLALQVARVSMLMDRWSDVNSIFTYLFGPSACWPEPWRLGPPSMTFGPRVSGQPSYAMLMVLAVLCTGDPFQAIG